MSSRRRPDSQPAGTRRRRPDASAARPANSDTSDDWSPDSTPFVEGYDAPVEAASPIAGVGVPAVVAVVTTRDPGPTFDALVQSIADQEYGNLITLIIDAGSAVDPTERVADVLPSAFVKRVDTMSFAQAANSALGVVDGGSFYLFLHDDVVLRPGTVQALVEEAFRSNAGIVGSKLLDGADSTKLLDVGGAIDKFGFLWPMAERGELDQSQHDAIREAFVVSSAAMLVRCDLFRDLGGFSTDIDGSGEDLDLCWRARVAGARSVVMPAAEVIHHETSTADEVHERSLHLALRHQARVMLACYSGLSLLRILPQAMVLGLADLFGALLRGRWTQARDVFMAFVWNVGHLPKTFSVRRATQKSRRTSDDEIRKLQIKGSARFTNFFHEYTARDRSMAQVIAAAARGVPGSAGPQGAGPWGLAAFVVAAVVILVGSRSLITGSVPAIREFVPISDTGALLREWWSGWRSAGFGQSGGAPTINLIAGVLGWITFGSDGLVRTLLAVGPLVAGAAFAWQLFRGITSPPARLVAMVAYLVNPIPYNAISEGRWQALVTWAVAPAILARLGRAGGFQPFDQAPNGDRSVLQQVFALGLLLAIAASAAPVVLTLTLVFSLLIAVVVGVGNRGDLGRLGIVTLGSLVVSAVLHLPWAVAVLSGSNRLDVLLGSSAGRGAPVAVTRAMFFDTGSHGTYLSLGLLVLIAVAVLITVGPAFRWTLFALVSAVGSFALVTLSGRLAPDTGLPVAEVLLVPAAVAAALAAGMAFESARTTVIGSAFGWRHLMSGLGVIAMLTASAPLVVEFLDGRWKAPVSDIDIALAPLTTDDVIENSRTLWIGDADAVSLSGWEFSDGMKFAVTDGVRPDLGALFPPAAGPAEQALDSLLDGLLNGETSRVGQRLAEFGIRYIVVQERLAPLPYGQTVYAIDASMKERLNQQFDLARVDVAPGIEVYENLVSVPVWSVSDPAAGAETATEDTSTESGSLAELVATARTALTLDGAWPTRIDTTIPDASSTLILTPLDDSWSLSVDGESVDLEPLGDWARTASVGAGDAELSHTTPPTQIVMHVLQLLALAVVLVNRRGARWWIGRARPHDPEMAELLTAEEFA